MKLQFDCTKEVWPFAKGKVLSRQEHYLHMQKNPLFNLIDDNFIGFPGKELGVFVCKIL